MSCLRLLCQAQNFQSLHLPRSMLTLLLMATEAWKSIWMPIKEKRRFKLGWVQSILLNITTRSSTWYERFWRQRVVVDEGNWLRLDEEKPFEYARGERQVFEEKVEGKGERIWDQIFETLWRGMMTWQKYCTLRNKYKNTIIWEIRF